MIQNENQWSIGEGGELPLGFGFRLAANEKAMAAFAKMSDIQKHQIVEESRQQHTREAMEQFVDRLGEKTT